MRLGGVVLMRTAVAYVRAHDDQGRPARFRFCSLDGAVQCCDVVGVGDVLNVPAVCLEARAGIIAEGERSVTFDRDVIVVVEADQLAESGVTGEGCGFV